MTKIRITKEFSFETSHALYQYDGLCKNIHGHSYKLFVTLIGEPINDIENPKLGMVMDFGDLKKIVNKLIVNKFDHSIILNSKSKLSLSKSSEEMFIRIHFVDYQPTCENLVIYFAKILKKHLQKNVELFSIKLHETANSYAEWFASDN